ncbi:MAG: hypothetical protein P1U50_01145 [Parvibaculaceae bacterium]|nr:hypothetical protein [Parvibaculaceae bacterium]
MKKSAIRFVTCLAVIATVTNASALEYDWKTSVNTDAMTDEKIVSAYLWSNTSAGRRTEEVEIGCIRGMLLLTFSFGHHRFPSTGTEITYRRDKAPAKKTMFHTNKNNDRLYVVAQKARKIVRKLMTSKTFLIQATDVQGTTTRAVEYHTKGMSEAVNPVIKACAPKSKL